MIRFLGIIFGLIVLYWQGFRARFFQDDRLILALTKSGEWTNSTVGNVFRPLALQGFYGLNLALFGESPLGFHITMFCLFCLTLYFIYKLSDLFTVFLYAFNVSLFAYFYWVATSYFVLAGLFVFSSLYFATKNKVRFYLPLFIAGLLSNELAIVEIGLLILFRKIKAAAILAVIGLPYMIWRYLVFSLPAAPDYRLDFSLKFFATLRWYVLRALNLPEGIQNDQNLLIYILLALLVLICIINFKNFRISNFGFSALWMLIGAFPFYFLPGHMSSYYLGIALFGPALFFSKTIQKYQALFCFVYFLMTILGLNFLSQSHWIILKRTL